jgi:hypothetical protein
MALTPGVIAAIVILTVLVVVLLALTLYFALRNTGNTGSTGSSNGSVGPTGPQGPQGPVGATGPGFQGNFTLSGVTSFVAHRVYIQLPASATTGSYPFCYRDPYFNNFNNLRPCLPFPPYGGSYEPAYFVTIDVQNGNGITSYPPSDVNSGQPLCYSTNILGDTIYITVTNNTLGTVPATIRIVLVN